jgi:hypothetical protein
VTVGTLFHKTRVDLQKWFLAIALMLDIESSITVRQLAAEIEVNRNTACYMGMRIRKSIRQELSFLQKLI